MSIQTLASLTCALLALAATFQAGLAAGAPWGAAAYGGGACRRTVGAGAVPALLAVLCALIAAS